MAPDDQMTGRVSKLEEDVSTLKVETAKIGTSLEAFKDSSTERHEYVKESLAEIKQAVHCEDAHASTQARWLREILTPQTIAIVLAILASALGAPMVAQQLLGPAAIPPATPPGPVIERMETQPSPSTQP